MDLEYFEVTITANKREADELYSMLTNMGLDHMEIPPIPVSAMKDFIDGKREKLWDVTVNDKVYLTFEGTPDAVSALIKLVKGAGVEQFPIAPLPAEHLRAYVNGQRDNVGLLEIRRNKDVRVRVKPEKEETDKKSSTKKTEKKEDK